MKSCWPRINGRSIRKTILNFIPFLVVFSFLAATMYNKNVRTTNQYNEQVLIAKAARSLVNGGSEIFSERIKESKKSLNGNGLRRNPKNKERKLSLEQLLASEEANTEEAFDKFVLSAPVVQYEKELQEKWDEKINTTKFLKTMPNEDFVFHNKLPKSGSTTMNNLLMVLSEKNKFNFLKVPSGPVRVSDTTKLIKYLHEEGEFQKPYFLLKHHAYFNFTKFGGEQPTFINVMREPISWITSRYYFARFGWERRPGVREDQYGILSPEDIKMEIEECVQLRRPSCTMDSDYIKFFCGHEKECTNATTYAEKRIAVEKAKHNILNNFFVVGILEQFVDTLKVFERLMPQYYKGAVDSYELTTVQKAVHYTKTAYKKELSDKAKEFLTNGPFHHEIELYEFAKKIFHKKMKELNIEPTPIEE